VLLTSEAVAAMRDYYIELRASAKDRWGLGLGLGRWGLGCGGLLELQAGAAAWAPPELSRGWQPGLGAAAPRPRRSSG
jgi:hypothetical protein